MAGGGDVDGDGLEDVLVTAKEANDGRGKTYLFYGSTLEGETGTFSLSDADHIFVGGDVEDKSGWSACFIGDIDGDDKDEILIGAPHAAFEDRGIVYVILSSTVESSPQSMSLFLADYIILGAESGGRLGWACVSAGDVDGDGLADIMVAATNTTHGIGGYGRMGDPSSAKTFYYQGTDIYIVLGSTLNEQPTGVPLDVFEICSYTFYTYNFNNEVDDIGRDFMASGDIDNDGLSDLCISGCVKSIVYHSGWPMTLTNMNFFVILGTRLAELDKGPHELRNLYQNESSIYNFSKEVYSIDIPVEFGDFDNDGHDDLVVGAQTYSYGSQKKANVFLGSSMMAVAADPEQVYIQPDYTLLLTEDNLDSIKQLEIGDINGDEKDDLLVSIDYVDDVEKVFAFSGENIISGLAQGTSEADAIMLGEVQADNAISIGLSDIDGDGGKDVLVGSSNHDLWGTDAGKAYLIYGIGTPEPPSPKSNLKISKVKINTANNYAYVTVVNNGTGPVPPGTKIVLWYNYKLYQELYKRGYFVSKIALNVNRYTGLYEGLAPGESITRKLHVYPQYYKMIFRVDPENLIDEENENDNSYNLLSSETKLSKSKKSMKKKKLSKAKKKAKKAKKAKKKARAIIRISG